jgi:tetratricopeptide (TPR) repeat protein
VIRPIAAADLEKRVLEVARRDKRRALAMLERGLEENPRHLGLLCAKALLAERAGELEQASEALKTIVHLQLENSASEDARATLKKLQKLDEDDPFVWEKSFELALEHGRRKDAFAHGKRLIELYAGPGLHKKVCSVHERLIEAFGGSWELVRDLARARAAGGDRDAAAKGLESYASTMISADAYPQACRAYEEALAIAPGRKKTKEALEDVKSGHLAQRRVRWRRRRRIAAATFVLFVVGPWVTWEALARRAYVEATREAVRGGDVDQLRGRFEALRERYFWTATARYDVAPVIEEIDARERAQAATRR